MSIADIPERRFFHTAFGHGVRAARVEAAAGWRIDRVRHVAAEDDALAILLDVRVRLRHSGQQGLRVGMQRIAEQLVLRRDLHDLAEVHDDDAVADMANDGQIVRDEQVGELVLLLDIH